MLPLGVDVLLDLLLLFGVEIPLAAFLFLVTDGVEAPLELILSITFCSR